ncbi:hypothetical protein BC829DRAFT_404144 [Chytridium lagenaria]|nr:hypothetical protein BC829DRAFT_404144 [Chytridium lagenaria]
MKSKRISRISPGKYLNVEELGGENVDSWSECTHLVTDRVDGLDKWLLESKKEGQFAPEAKFLLRDKTTEDKFKFSLAQSLKIAQGPSRPPLMQGVRVYATPNVKPRASELEEILGAAGGELLKAPLLSPPKDPKECVIIGCAEDEPECVKLEAAGWTIQSIEFVLTGILRQQLNFGGHLLRGVGNGASPSVGTPVHSVGTGVSTSMRKRR